LDYVASLAFIVNGEWKAAWQVLKAQVHFVKKLKSMKVKRIALKASSNNLVPNRKGIYIKSIVFSSFVKGKKHFSELDKNNFIS
jgi:hypothetical protein